MTPQHQGYHLCVNRDGKQVVIHMPANHRQCQPQPDSKFRFWLGPYATLDEAQDVAQDGGEYNDCDVHRCRKCIREPKPDPEQGRKRKKWGRMGFTTSRYR